MVSKDVVGLNVHGRRPEAELSRGFGWFGLYKVVGVEVGSLPQAGEIELCVSVSGCS